MSERIGKVHYRSGEARVFGIYEVLFCSGRSQSLAQVTRVLDDVTCGSCRRKLLKQAKAAPDLGTAA